LRSRAIHIFYITILFILISVLDSCEVDLSDTIRPVDSKIWVNAVVGIGNPVKIYIGNTSGVNSGDKAEYRDDAVVKLKVNSGSYNKLMYKIDPKSSYKGYYHYGRLENAAEGDTLSFKCWIPGFDFDTVKGVTYIPQKPVMPDPDVATTITPSGDFLVDIDVNIQDSLVKGKYFEIRLRELKYSDINSEDPSVESNVTLLNDLKLSYGLNWNERLNSTLFDYNNIEDGNLHLKFKVRNNFSAIKINFELRAITKDYFDYFKALDGGTIVKSNIINGSGIFSGYAKCTKKITIK